MVNYRKTQEGERSLETEEALQLTYVPIMQLRVGELIAEDILANTKFPIVAENTKLTYEHLHIFEVFNITEIPVLRAAGEALDIPQEESTITIEKPELIVKRVYAECVVQFKKEFKTWEAGAKVDMTKLRGILLPLIEMVLDDRTIIFDLNEYSDPREYLYHHCIATGLITGVIAQKLGYDRGVTIQLAIGGTLADSGMAKISPNIREKKGALSEMEFNEIRKHPIYSYQMIKDIPVLKQSVKAAVFQHHERLDGSGYPTGERGERIPMEAQIIAVADVFHAMTSERAYRAKQASFKVLEKIKEEEFGKFNLKVTDALLSVISDLSIGSRVLLSNLEKGEVLYINANAPTRPLIKLSRTGEIIDLQSLRHLHIQHILR